jgi:2'-5' RNA ligase
VVPDGSLIVIHLVESFAEGRRFCRTRTGWPLHITFIPWFTVPSEADILQELGTAAAGYAAFSVRVGEGALFGPERDVAVNVIATQEPCRTLHDALVELLRCHNASFISEQWMGEAFRAHITHHGERRREPGDTEAVNTITVVRLVDPDTCEVVRHFKLGDKS